MRRFFIVVIISCCWLLSSCGGGSTSSAPTPSNPAPAIQSLSPVSAAAGTGAFTLTVNGSGFVSGSAITWNGSPKATNYQSATQLSAAITATDLATEGSAIVAVVNPSPGGGQASSNFTVSPPAVPVVTNVTPDSVGVGSAGATLTVTGNNFIRSSTVQWSGSPRPTTYVDNTKLTATTTSSDVATGAYVPVTVSTPGTGASAAATVTVLYPLPTTTSIQPPTVTMGSAAFTVTVTGTNFFAGALVYWNNASRVTQYISSTQLTASILASDVVSAGTASVTVQNPSPSAGISNVVAFNIGSSVPQITQITPGSGYAGDTTLTLDIQGAGFLPTSSVQIGNLDMTKLQFSLNHVSSTELQISNFGSLPVGDIPVTVTNPAPGGGTSAPFTFHSLAFAAGVQSILVSIDPA
ncbi:MAG: hypothetical protein ACRD3E_01980, partial [Terriglobales bacterium]